MIFHTVKQLNSVRVTEFSVIWEPDEKNSLVGIERFHVGGFYSANCSRLPQPSSNAAECSRRMFSVVVTWRYGFSSASFSLGSHSVTRNFFPTCEFFIPNRRVNIFIFEIEERVRYAALSEKHVEIC